MDSRFLRLHSGQVRGNDRKANGQAQGQPLRKYFDDPLRNDAKKERFNDPKKTPPTASPDSDIPPANRLLGQGGQALRQAQGRRDWGLNRKCGKLTKIR